MKAYLPKSFRREAKSEGISDDDCKEAMRRAEQGLVDAELGGHLIKQRIPRGNRGAAKGARGRLLQARRDCGVSVYLREKRQSQSDEIRVG
jgi:hypothetical protein